MMWFTVETPLPTGPMRVAVTDEGVAAAAYSSDMAAEFPSGVEITRPADDRRAVRVLECLNGYFRGHLRKVDLPVDWRLTSDVQRKVLRTLWREVGFGQTITYGELATRSGAFPEDADQHAFAAKAVGSIMASNPVSLLVPCHRVVAASGVGGFGGGALGMETKRWLLTLEGSLAPTLDWTGPL
ncbi:methylated-DNA--[protein]-cysteine S-methyltransferase [Nonomuraea sp. NPDC050556]|uniref:methylated-DNA--[protein]-cysteine S-methyltransferase n=1 Tax=Nonomuraea sp. NPDC050556 TaxID=3364369 RepID=UPI00379BA69D